MHPDQPKKGLFCLGIAAFIGLGSLTGSKEAAEKVAREAAEKVARENAKKLDDEQQKRIVPLLATEMCPEGSAIEPFNRTYCVKDKT
jgi:hypothetical protein